MLITNSNIILNVRITGSENDSHIMDNKKLYF